VRLSIYRSNKAQAAEVKGSAGDADDTLRSGRHLISLKFIARLVDGRVRLR
jgi:hypothetical protein